jgi:hypothetical protein
MKPKILLATTTRWFSTARLAIAFSEIGCRVEMVGPMGHPACRTTALDHRHKFRGLAPRVSFHAAIRKAQPDLIIPCDDLATIQLHRLCEDLSRSGQAGSRLLTVLRNSLGPSTSFAVLESRSKLMALADALGIRVPKFSIVNKDNLVEWLSVHGLPAFLKTDGSGGGLGVQIVHSVPAAKVAIAELSAPPLVARAIKRAIFDQDRTLLKPYLKKQRPVVSAQVLVTGRDATISVACWNGEIIASFAFEVVQAQAPGGPSSVLRRMDSPEMLQAAQTIIRELSLSGLLGFDFILNEQDHSATLIEMNARATQVCHLSLATGRDLAAALVAKAGNETVNPRLPLTDQDLIALFPQEWHRDPGSSFLRIAYHDVPWQQPELMKACIDFYFAQQKWYASRRLTDLYRKLTTTAPLVGVEHAEPDFLGEKTPEPRMASAIYRREVHGDTGDSTDELAIRIS